ncbi:MAG: hypothetical protein HRT82_13620 [Henriciella sp.]|nr:hypothetical protein [Henriciella sp.]
MTEADETAPAQVEDVSPADAPPRQPFIKRAGLWVETHPLASLLICLGPALLAILSPNFLTQCLCLAWGLLNLSVLVWVMLYNRDLRSSRRLIVSFASIIAVTQVFGSAYAATLLSSDSVRHFRFSQYSNAADFNERRLAARILSDSHADAIGKLNAHFASEIERGAAEPEGYPFERELRWRPCPNAGTALLLFYTCKMDRPFERSDEQLFKAERLFDAVFEIDRSIETLYIMRSRDTRNSAVAAMLPLDPKPIFFENSGGALLTYVYGLETEQRTSPLRTDRRAMIEYLSDVAKATLREDGARTNSLLPSERVLTGDDGLSRLKHAVADTLLCAQYAKPDYIDGKCEPVPEFARLVSDQGWDAPDARPGVLASDLRPLDLVLSAYLTEMLYWDIKSMEQTEDRRELVINGMIFSAMAVMTSGFSDMSPTSYLTKFLLILQFLAYVLLIILILPMSFERPKEEED